MQVVLPSLATQAHRGAYAGLSTLAASVTSGTAALAPQLWQRLQVFLPTTHHPPASNISTATWSHSKPADQHSQTQANHVPDLVSDELTFQQAIVGADSPEVLPNLASSGAGNPLPVAANSDMTTPVLADAVWDLGPSATVSQLQTCMRPHASASHGELAAVIALVIGAAGAVFLTIFQLVPGLLDSEFWAHTSNAWSAPNFGHCADFL
jgi:hypothetical protein